MVEININEKNEKQRLDKYLLKYFNKAPKNFIYKILRKKYIKINGKRALGSEILLNKDKINIYLADDTIQKFKEDKIINKASRNFKIIFEDENIIICYKPIGLVSQPDANNKINSLNDQLIYYMYEKNEYKKTSDFSPSICNRLDKYTSGICIFGKNLRTLQDLSYILKQNLLDKHYITAVEGEIKKDGVMELFHKKEDGKISISNTYKDGYKKIITKYKPIKIKDKKTLLDVQIITGKTHQIRSSFEHIGYPIIGDKKYGNNNEFGLKHQFLHCYKIKFKDFDNSIKYLKGKSFECEYMDTSFRRVIDFFNK